MTTSTAGSGLVYSTESGRMCPDCRQPKSRCICKTASVWPPAGDGVVRVMREAKGRGGKVVTLVRGLALPSDALADLARKLKAACGSGGTVKDGVVEIQGDHCDRVILALKQHGYVAKRAGG